MATLVVLGGEGLNLSRYSTLSDKYWGPAPSRALQSSLQSFFTQLRDSDERSGVQE